MTGISKDNHSNPFASPKVTPTNEPIGGSGECLLSDYTSVRFGLRIIYFSTSTIVAVFVTVILCGVAFGLYGNAASSGFREVFFVAAVICLFATLSTIIGFCLMLGSPRSDEKPFAIMSVICLFLAIGGTLTRAFLTRAVQGQGVLISLGIPLLSVACVLTFCLLLKRIGRNISSSGLEKNALSMLVWYGIFIALGFAGIVTVLFYVSANGGPKLTKTADFANLLVIVFGVTMVIIAIITVCKFFLMLKACIYELNPQRDSAIQALKSKTT